MDAMSFDHSGQDALNCGMFLDKAIVNEWMNGESIEGEGDHLMQSLVVSTSRFKQSNISKRSVAGPSVDRKRR